jgi:3-phenylpropionate/trans-cinnamate dioxygenase ferredoxin component
MAFIKVAAVGDFPDTDTLKVELGGEPICVVRLADGSFRAVHDTCSHQEYPLHEGYIEENGAPHIECALHGSSFNLDTGEPDSLPAVKPIPTYACKVTDGEVHVDVDQQLNDAPVPRHY